jgi:phosphoribosylpyrophosphate synthetase
MRPSWPVHRASPRSSLTCRDGGVAVAACSSFGSWPGGLGLAPLPGACWGVLVPAGACWGNPRSPAPRHISPPPHLARTHPTTHHTRTHSPYNKQSKKKYTRGSITAKLVANMLYVAGIDHVITMDLHASQIQGFFNKPVDNLLAEPTIAKYLKDRFPDPASTAVICKNAGGAKRWVACCTLTRERDPDGGREGGGAFPSPRLAYIHLPPPSHNNPIHPTHTHSVTSLADRLQTDFGLIHREKHHNNGPSGGGGGGGLHVDTGGAPLNGGKGARPGPRQKEPEEDEEETRLTLVGNVQGRVCFLVDDVMDSPFSFLEAAAHLKTCGASKVFIVATHGILSGNAVQLLEACAAVDEVGACLWFARWCTVSSPDPWPPSYFTRCTPRHTHTHTQTCTYTPGTTRSSSPTRTPSRRPSTAPPPSSASSTSRACWPRPSGGRTTGSPSRTSSTPPFRHWISGLHWDVM